ncbi:hypothetical protein ACL03H_18220 [Saccharopolyspora sp. MS10]|uniref:hypothetical protein n=1 Tax=Saccharopolyspora sp. MS10 TaxID=3385973 RepID=UPI0039A1CA0D
MSGARWAKAPAFADRPLLRERLRESTAADRREQLEGGLRPVECARCGGRVLAKKNSPAHTSAQWSREAVRRCPELTGAAEDGGTARVAGCPDLERSIGEAMLHATEEPD